MRKRNQQRINTPSTPSTSPSAEKTSSLFSGIFQGFSFGAGTSIAHNIFRIPYTGASIHPSNEQMSVCETLKKDYIQACAESISVDPKKCELMLENLQLICQKS